ncbi:21S rRNA (uridine2791-2'-O) methyltransferase [Sporobolomyces koalae]|uniref:21S rRNA (uridine2791-2'-O) methyltransferase n=1 Tax=Sporobolomyces koalae TaxID=500713 RepID=UPI0031733AEB
MSRFVAPARQFTRCSSSASSSVWIQRQRNDPYVRQRQTANEFVSRSAFKLVELDDKLNLIRPDMVLVDLGAAPGGWIQAANRSLDGTGAIVGVDLLPLKLANLGALEGVGFVKGDFLNPTTQAKLKQTLVAVTGKSNPRVDLVLSDMMANTTGSTLRDSALSLTLCESALSFALETLSPSPISSYQLVMKHFTSNETKPFQSRLRQYFKVVKWIKPESSRKESREGFLVCGGLRPRDSWPREARDSENGSPPEDSLYF